VEPYVHYPTGLHSVVLSETPGAALPILSLIKMNLYYTTFPNIVSTCVVKHFVVGESEFKCNYLGLVAL
jgi:hypothetical protein